MENKPQTRDTVKLVIIIWAIIFFVVSGIILLSFIPSSKSNSSSIETQRSDFKKVYSQLQSLVKDCNNGIINDTTAVEMLSKGQASAVSAYKVAQKADQDCALASGTSDSVTIPDSLSSITPNGASLNTAVQEIGDWLTYAQEVMADSEQVIQNPNDLAHASDFDTKTNRMDVLAISAESTLKGFALELGISDYHVLGLVTWQGNK